MSWTLSILIVVHGLTELVDWCSACLGRDFLCRMQVRTSSAWLGGSQFVSNLWTIISAIALRRAAITRVL